MKKNIRQIIFSAAMTFALGVMGLASVTTDDYDIYLDGPFPSGGANIINPEGDSTAYFAFSDAGHFIDGSVNTAPQSPQGGNYIIGSVNFNSTFGGVGTAFTVNPGDSTQVPRDLSVYEGGNLKFYLRSDRNLQVEIQSDDGSGNLVISSAVAVNSTGGSWALITIPLNSTSFGTAVDFTKIRVPFLIKIPSQYASPDTVFRVDNIRWEAPTGASLDVSSSTVKVNPGKRRLFTVLGADYGSWTRTATGLGTFDVASGSAVVLTAGGSLQAGTVDVAVRGFTGTSNVTITNEDLSAVFGVHAESISGVVFDNNATFVPFSGGGASITTSNNTGEKREGTFSVQTDINVGPTGQFAGWTVLWTTGSVEMTNYYDGTLRFWFKGPSALQDVLEVGVRSINVIVGQETSKVLLKNYTTFDDTWRTVSIPIADFAGVNPKADISRIKNLATFVAGGNTGGNQTFYVDKLRWDTETPGALTSIVVTPDPVSIPTDVVRRFKAKGLDASSAEVDIHPTWSKTGLGGSSFVTSVGESVLFNAASSAETGQVQATQSGTTGTSSVSVQDIVITQSFNVYSDNGTGGFVGVSKGGDPTTDLTLSELSGGSPPEGTKFQRATYTLKNTAGNTDAFALWFVQEPGSQTRYLKAFEDGFLQFHVKTNKDLEVSIRSDNITAGTEKSKIKLSDLGIPLDNQWRKVVISFDIFRNLEPNLDFEKMKVFFAIAAISQQIGEVTNEVFDVDNVIWLTASSTAVDPDKVYNGLKAKQNATTGLVLSFDNDGAKRAVTYDNALTAMNYTYKKDTALAKDVFDYYKAVFDAASPFAGFHEEYKHDVAANGTGSILDPDRTAGPNAWMLLALIHYKNVTGQTTYDAVIAGIANWLKSLQDTDGAIKFGFLGNPGTAANNKSTEHNLDCYAAFLAYAKHSGDTSFITEAEEILNWLNTEMWSGTYLYVGETAAGIANTDKALDNYSWAPPATSSFTSVLAQAEADFRVVKKNNTTGVNVDGFDFSGAVGQPVDKDAVWLEGTAQMVVAFQSIQNTTKANFYSNELDKAVFVTSTTTQGLTYATNNGTAYGFTMPSLNAAASSMAWYLFARNKFNPFQPFPLARVEVKNISDNVKTTTMTWTVNIPAKWVRADQYVLLDAQPVSTDPWGIQIYTTNAGANANPRFVDPTPSVTNNLDSDPAGLLKNEPTTGKRLAMAWSIKDTTTTIPSPAPFDQCPSVAAACQWVVLRDTSTPSIDLDGDGSDDTPAFTNGEEISKLRKAAGIQSSQGSFFQTLSPDYIYFESNFIPAAAQVNYRTIISIEFFNE